MAIQIRILRPWLGDMLAGGLARSSVLDSVTGINRSLKSTGDTS
jgi:hypothetical protein